LYVDHDSVVLKRINVSNPSSPGIIATISGTLGAEVVPAGNYVYFPYSGPYQTLAVYTDPPATAFPFLTTVTCAGCGDQVAAAADREILFLGQDDGSLWIYRFTPEVTGAFLPLVSK
jgi:hypothetical protein